MKGHMAPVPRFGEWEERPDTPTYSGVFDQARLRRFEALSSQAQAGAKGDEVGARGPASPSSAPSQAHSGTRQQRSNSPTAPPHEPAWRREDAAGDWLHAQGTEGCAASRAEARVREPPMTTSGEGRAASSKDGRGGRRGVPSPESPSLGAPSPRALLPPTGQKQSGGARGWLSSEAALLSGPGQDGGAAPCTDGPVRGRPTLGSPLGRREEHASPDSAASSVRSSLRTGEAPLPEDGGSERGATRREASAALPLDVQRPRGHADSHPSPTLRRLPQFGLWELPGLQAEEGLTQMFEQLLGECRREGSPGTPAGDHGGTQPGLAGRQPAGGSVPSTHAPSGGGEAAGRRTAVPRAPALVDVNPAAALGGSAQSVSSPGKEGTAVGQMSTGRSPLGQAEEGGGAGFHVRGGGLVVGPTEGPSMMAPSLRQAEAGLAAGKELQGHAAAVVAGPRKREGRAEPQRHPPSLPTRSASPRSPAAVHTPEFGRWVAHPEAGTFTQEFEQMHKGRAAGAAEGRSSAAAQTAAAASSKVAPEGGWTGHAPLQPQAADRRFRHRLSPFCCLSPRTLD